MLSKLRKLLPEFEISKDGNVYDIKRLKPDGQWLHIPAILFKKDLKNIEDIAKGIKESWRGYVEGNSSSR